ncbi:glycoside hydrolase family 17 protein [Conidiobolus coronatus NRRL 28638]|uniref:glucan endo-1,3-beta-D-glucosidase n=1 Tax=Conidiobolus coronatus (strain ATCC 28846 / CBS 209.66 / NRRL 28638) TaxID=796925 RepID=A0A137P5H4_CONC2|nr:glycoside hydrolase family 17 protein [Conidiobolus coronatus NRRL 28638]|eukprot:KXN70247.1 glycoside hydrolase family 17 protein [Conidiobolus coronatus NRRL 28638]
MTFQLIKLAVLSLASLAVAADKPIFGLGYNAKHSNGQCPDLNKVIDDFNTMLTVTDRIRTFGINDCNQGELIVQASQATGMKVSLGIFINQYDQEFNSEFEKLKDLTYRYRDTFNKNVESVIVGSEAIYRKEITNDALAQKVYSVKGFLRDTGIASKVTAADIKDNWYPSPLLDAVDLMFVNAYPYWEGVPIKSGVDHLWSKIGEVMARTGGKRFVLGETGWPQGGKNFGDAYPSQENQIFFFEQFLCSVKKAPVPLEYYWFSAFDEAWKGTEADMKWGIFDENRSLKPGYKFPVDCSKY